MRGEVKQGVRQRVDRLDAVLTIHDAPARGKTGRRMLAKWLRHQADKLELEGDLYAPRFRGRYITKVLV